MANARRRIHVEHKRPLRRLPVPNLKDTLRGYLKSIEPFLLEDEARGGTPFQTAMMTRQKLVEDFENGIGKVCQERLLELDQKSPHNWLDDNFWLKKAYHEWRAPLLINSNWWLIFENDPNVPKNVIEGDSDANKAGITPWQVRRAVWLLHRTLIFKDNTLSPDVKTLNATGVWLHNTTSSLFNTCRIPALGCDQFSTPANAQEARNVVLLLHDWFYSVEVLDSAGAFVGCNEVERRFQQVVSDAEKRLLAGERAAPVGVLTADERDAWAKNRKHLLNLSPTNQSTLRTIETSLLAICLDNYTLGQAPSPPIPHTSEMICHLHNVRSSRRAHNRWFDKSISYVVESNSRAGMMGEHSPCDALVPSIIADFALTENVDVNCVAFNAPKPSFGNSVERGHDSAYLGWKRLDWVTDEHIALQCVKSEQAAEAIIENSDVGVLWFSDYGAHWIKAQANLPPDAYIQAALQLTWYRLRGCFTATYETALTRLFWHGRTETIRSFSTASRKFILSAVDPTSSQSERYQSLQDAVRHHVALTRSAATGKGIDRHLMGLKLVLEEGERAELFDDAVFSQTQEWKLSTSGLSAGIPFRGTGFGSPFEDGYGINYMAALDKIKFGIESKHSSPLTSTSQFQTMLTDTLMDMKRICIEGNYIGDNVARL